MPFWLVVLFSLIGVPMILFATGMGAIFAAGGYAGGPQESRAQTVVYGWLTLAWVLVSVFGAFGVVPLWRGWHGGPENFDGGLELFFDWLMAIGAIGVLVSGVVRALNAIGGDRADRRGPSPGVKWLLLTLGLVPWAAIVAWLAWPLLLWPVNGRFAWPDAATGWIHTAEIAAVLVVAMVIEETVRKRRKG